jgi:hypothetical protein
MGRLPFTDTVEGKYQAVLDDAKERMAEAEAAARKGVAPVMATLAKVADEAEGEDFLKSEFAKTTIGRLLAGLPPRVAPVLAAWSEARVKVTTDTRAARHALVGEIEAKVVSLLPEAAAEVAAVRGGGLVQCAQDLLRDTRYFGTGPKGRHIHELRVRQQQAAFNYGPSGVLNLRDPQGILRLLGYGPLLDRLVRLSTPEPDPAEATKEATKGAK